jgi:hypothetical protein
MMRNESLAGSAAPATPDSFQTILIYLKMRWATLDSTFQ